MGGLRCVEGRRVKVSLVVVCHHSSGVLPRCVSSFRSHAEAAGVESEVVVVEHSENDGEAAAAAACAPERILVRPNRGYAAGLNAGVAEASGELVFLANPDIEFLEGGVGGLVDAIAAGADVAGPQLVWDPAGEVLLPVPDDPGPVASIALSAALFVLTIGAYLVTAHLRHQENPQDKLVPTLSEVGEGFYRPAFEADRRGEYRLLVNTVASGRRFLISVALKIGRASCRERV